MASTREILGMKSRRTADGREEAPARRSHGVNVDKKACWSHKCYIAPKANIRSITERSRHAEDK